MYHHFQTIGSRLAASCELLPWITFLVQPSTHHSGLMMVSEPAQLETEPELQQFDSKHDGFVKCGNFKIPKFGALTDQLHARCRSNLLLTNQRRSTQQQCRYHTAQRRSHVTSLVHFLYRRVHQQRQRDHRVTWSRTRRDETVYQVRTNYRTVTSQYAHDII